MLEKRSYFLCYFRHLEDKYSSTVAYYDIKARISLKQRDGKSALAKLERACDIYEEGLRSAEEGDKGRIHDMYVDFLLDLARNLKNAAKEDSNPACWAAKQLHSALETGKKLECLSQKNKELLESLG